MATAGQRGAESLIAAATDAGHTVVHAAGTTIIVIAAPVADGDDLLTLDEAATIAKCSVRALTGARRAGELVMLGKQRSRTVRRSDLLAWIESRRAPVVRGVDDAEMDRRIARLLSRSRRTG